MSTSHDLDLATSADTSDTSTPNTTLDVALATPELQSLYAQYRDMQNGLKLYILHRRGAGWHRDRESIEARVKEAGSSFREFGQRYSAEDQSNRQQIENFNLGAEEGKMKELDGLEGFLDEIFYLVAQQTMDVEVAKKLLATPRLDRRLMDRYRWTESDPAIQANRDLEIKQIISRLEKIVKPSTADRIRDGMRGLLEKVGLRN